MILKNKPCRTVEPQDIDRPATAGRACCPQCDKTFVATAIVTGHDHAYIDTHGQTYRCRLRQLFCDHCDCILQWYEACGPDGGLTAYIVKGPQRIYSASIIDSFLKAHPEARGVVS